MNSVNTATADPSQFLQIRNVTKDFSGYKAVNNVSLDITKGAIFALLGSLILSLTYVPAMLALIMRGKVSEKESPLIRWSKLIYKP